MNAMGVKDGNVRGGRLLSTVAALALGWIGAGHALAQPNLVVRIDNQVVANNSEHIFPDTPVGQFNQLVVVLRNEGNETLAFTENPPIIMSEGFPEQFALIQPALEAGNVLSPNGSTAFAVRFQPQLATSLSLFTHIYVWTSAGATPFHLIVRGQASSPKAIVKLDGETVPDLGEVVFEETTVGDTRDLVFTIENQGNAPLELTDNPPVFLGGGLGEFVMAVTQQPDSTIAPGESSTFRVQFMPAEGRFYSTRLFIPVNENSATVNTLFDIDLVGDGVLTDCNNNGVDDVADIADGVSEDCNSNGLPDECDIAAGTSTDANANGTPDGCETDCNGNGQPDDLDLASGMSNDCDADGTLDECEDDFDSDGVPDDCDNCPATINTDQADADEDGTGDVCDPSDDRLQDDMNPDSVDDMEGNNEPEQQAPDQENPNGIACGAGAMTTIPMLMLGMAGMKARTRRKREI